MLTATEKEEIIGRYGRKPGDTGCPEVQVALLTKRISQITEHLRSHSNDHHSRRGLLLLVSQRRALLDYLKREDLERYRTLVGSLGLRG